MAKAAKKDKKQSQQFDFNAWMQANGRQALLGVMVVILIGLGVFVFKESEFSGDPLVSPTEITSIGSDGGGYADPETSSDGNEESGDEGEDSGFEGSPKENLAIVDAMIKPRQPLAETDLAPLAAFDAFDAKIIDTFSQRSQQADQIVLRAQQAEKAGDDATALKLIREALMRVPSHKGAQELRDGIKKKQRKALGLPEDEETTQTSENQVSEEITQTTDTNE